MELKYAPERHDHKAFLTKAAKRPGFKEAYDALEVEYALAREMLAARRLRGAPTNGFQAFPHPKSIPPKPQ